MRGLARGAAKHKDELNQIYTLARLGDQVVAGTQGGVVVWSANGGKAARRPRGLHLQHVHRGATRCGPAARARCCGGTARRSRATCRARRRTARVYDAPDAGPRRRAVGAARQEALRLRRRMRTGSRRSTPAAVDRRRRTTRWCASNGEEWWIELFKAVVVRQPHVARSRASSTRAATRARSTKTSTARCGCRTSSRGFGWRPTESS